MSAVSSPYCVSLERRQQQRSTDLPTTKPMLDATAASAAATAFSVAVALLAAAVAFWNSTIRRKSEASSSRIATLSTKGMIALSKTCRRCVFKGEISHIQACVTQILADSERT